MHVREFLGVRHPATVMLTSCIHADFTVAQGRRGWPGSQFDHMLSVVSRTEVYTPE